MDVSKYSKELYDHIMSTARHPFLSRHLKEPALDMDKLKLLILILQRLDINQKVRRQSITAAMLVQTALELHDEVREFASGEDEKMLRDRQLTVLAGDYYSGLYYFILSDLGDIKLIKALAEGIKHVNDQKIRLGQKTAAGPEELLDCLRKIESSLLVKAGQAFGVDEYTAFIGDTLLLQRLKKERHADGRKGGSAFYDAYSYMRFGKDFRDLEDPQRSQLQNEWIGHIERLRKDCMKQIRELSKKEPNIQAFLPEGSEEKMTIYKLAEEG